MAEVTIHAAKTNLSKLIARAQAGEEIVILKGRTPVARLMPIAQAGSKRRFGAYKGEFSVPDSFFDPLPEEELAAWEGKGYHGDPLGHPHAAVVDEREREVAPERPGRDRKGRR